MDMLFYGFVVLLFAAVILAVEGIYLWWMSTHGAAARRIARRLQVMSGGTGPRTGERISILKQRPYSRIVTLDRLLHGFAPAQRIDTLLVQSCAFVEPVAHYADRAKIQYYPNSMDISSPKAVVPMPSELLELLEQHFCVVFAGNLGTAQALETIVQAAAHLRDDPHIRLVLVGSGSRLAWLKAQQQAHGLDNLVLPGRFPVEAMPQLFERASALLVSLNDEPAFAQTIPSKIQAYLAAGRPIIACMNGEGARVVCEARAGLASPAEQVLPLVANIQRIKEMGDAERITMGQSGKAYFDANFEMERQVEILVKYLAGTPSSKGCE